MNESSSHLKGQLQAVVLVVDDEPTICWAFERLLGDLGHQVLTASSAEEGLELARLHQPILVLLDVRLPKEDGISALPKFRSAVNGTPVIVMTAFGDLETAVAAVQQGAFEYLIKPFALEDARRVCQNALSSLVRRNARSPLSNRSSRNEKIVGQSAAIQQAFRQIALVAASELSVLVTGETGTGKELVAAAIHRHSHRSDAVYLPISPVALNEDLIESELFGHVKGAFTGASEDREGLFERAEGGTVLLDEIGDLPLSIQVKLLRVLEQGEYARVGDVTPRRCDVRVIAATNCNLQDAVRSGTFREDLYYRLNGLHIHLPPLRDRVEDIGMLCQHFLSQFSSDETDQVISEEVGRQLATRPWYGNVRELRNAVEHAAVVARGREITLADFPPAQPALTVADQSDASLADEKLRESIAAWIGKRLDEPDISNLQASWNAETEPLLLRLVLEKTSNNRAQAAELLGIHRGTLREKLKGYGIE